MLNVYHDGDRDQMKMGEGHKDIKWGSREFNMKYLRFGKCLFITENYSEWLNSNNKGITNVNMLPI